MTATANRFGVTGLRPSSLVRFALDAFSPSCHTFDVNKKTMLEIRRFLGIVIRMFYRDNAPPHFHAEYGAYEITVEIETGVVEGKFPKRALRAFLEWADLHRDDLLADWHLARLEQPLNSIEPLE